MNAAKTGFVAEFKTAYLQREIRMEAAVQNGTDVGLVLKQVSQLED